MLYVVQNLPTYYAFTLLQNLIKINSRNYVLLEALVAVTNAGSTIISCVGDNCKTNVAVYGKLGGPGKAFIML